MVGLVWGLFWVVFWRMHCLLLPKGGSKLFWGSRRAALVAEMAFGIVTINLFWVFQKSVMDICWQALPVGKCWSIPELAVSAGSCEFASSVWGRRSLLVSHFVHTSERGERGGGNFFSFIFLHWKHDCWCSKKLRKTLVCLFNISDVVSFVCVIDAANKTLFFNHCTVLYSGDRIDVN